ncbi:RimJ/RimL family protein N-acetyltransferase [Azospirillaceae bacterium]
MPDRLLHFRRPTLDDARTILDWRTDPEISRHMFSDITYDLDKQRAWITSISQRSDYRHFIIGTEGRSIGYLSYSQIDSHNGHCVPGFYVGDRDARTSAASYLHWFIMDYAFFGMGMNKVISQVMDCNTRMAKSLRLLKEREVGIYRRHIRKADGYHDVHVFELMREEWETHPRLFPLEQTLGAFEESTAT